VKTKLDLYGMIPLKLLQECTLHEIRVYGALSSFQGNGETCWPTRAQIEKRCSLPKCKISTATKGLEDKGWIIKLQRGKKQSNIYQCLYEVSEVTESGTTLKSEVTESVTSEVTESVTSILKEQLKEQLVCIVNYWLLKPNLKKFKFETALKKFKKHHWDILHENDPMDILSAIDNYDIICGGNGEYWFTYKIWKLWDFLDRGLEKFLPESEPLKQFKTENKKQKQSSEDFQKAFTSLQNLGASKNGRQA